MKRHETVTAAVLLLAVLPPFHGSQSLVPEAMGLRPWLYNAIALRFKSHGVMAFHVIQDVVHLCRQ